MSRIGQTAVVIVLLAVAVGALAWQRGWLGHAGPAGGTVAAVAANGAGPRQAAGQGAGGQAGQANAQAGQRFGAGGGGVPVITAKVTSESDGVEVTAVGTVNAARSITLFPQVTGVVKSISFTPGATVNEGDVLLQLVADDKSVAVEQAQLTLDTAQEALARSQTLVKSNAISTVSVTDAENAVRKAQIDLRAAQIELDKYTIRAPFTGLIGLTDVSVGDLVTTQKAIATLDDMATVTVAFSLPERASGLVAVGQKVSAATPALADRTFGGSISAVDSRVDPTTRTLAVQAQLPNDARILKPGMALTVSMSFPGEPRAAVPSLAVQWDKSGSYVWKVADGAAHRAGVSIVGRRSGLVLVADGVAAGEDVVVEGLQRLREGAQVVPAGGGGRPQAPPAKES